MMVTTNHICTFVFLWEYHPEDGHSSGRNMLVRKLWLKYIIKIELPFVGYLYRMNMCEVGLGYVDLQEW